jgi:hypothetical protein
MNRRKPIKTAPAIDADALKALAREMQAFEGQYAETVKVRAFGARLQQIVGE